MMLLVAPRGLGRVREKATGVVSDAQGRIRFRHDGPGGGNRRWVSAR
jgi:hypothetical protein